MNYQIRKLLPWEAADRNRSILTRGAGVPGCVRLNIGMVEEVVAAGFPIRSCCWSETDDRRSLALSAFAQLFFLVS